MGPMLEEPNAPPRPSPARGLLWALPVALLVLAVIAVPLLVLSEEGLPRYHALREELSALRLENEELRDEVRRLRERVHRLRTDPREIERIARDELGLLGANEIAWDL